MSYIKKDLKPGITFHRIETNKFKTNLFAIFLTTPLDRETVSKNALISAVLRCGCNKLKTQEEISKELENMYGADFDCGVEKSVDNHIIKFYLEVLNDEFLPEEMNDDFLPEVMDDEFLPEEMNDEFLPGDRKKEVLSEEASEELTKNVNIYDKKLIRGRDNDLNENNGISYLNKEPFGTKNKKNTLAQKALQLLFNIVFNPLVEGNGFKKEYLITEKNTLKTLIDGKIDNKGSYAVTRCIEEMFKNQNYGLYKFGYVEDFDYINEENLLDYYKQLISECKIDVLVSGYNIPDLHEDEIFDTLSSRATNYTKNNIEKLIFKNYEDFADNRFNDNLKKSNWQNVEQKEDNRDIYKSNQSDDKVRNNVMKDVSVTNSEIENESNSVKIVTESMDVTQGKLVIGYDLFDVAEDESWAATIFNGILGGGANSKLFQNVREKESMAYTATSSYLKYKSRILVRCGIEIQNYEKVVELVDEQIEQIKNGDFTDDDIVSVKNLIFESLKNIPDSQEGELEFYFAQEFLKEPISIENRMKKFAAVTRAEVIAIANKCKKSMIYFLRD